MSQLIVAASTLDSWFNKSGNRWLLADENGLPVVAFTSFLSADIRNESKVVSAPVEEGSFATYNKVATPLEVNVTLGIQGDDSTLQDALDTLTTLQAGTQLVSLVTPNAEYPDLNLEGFNYSRKRENGLGVLFVELSLVEVKQVAAQYTNAELSPRRERGKVQTRETSAAAGIGAWVRSHF